jgi:hypothetical protein
MRRRALTPGRDPKFLGFVALAVVAMLAAGLFGYVTFRGGDGTADQAAPVSADTSTFVSRAGGFSVAVPRGLQVTRSGSSARLTSPDRDLVVSVGPIAGGRLSEATRTLLETVRRGYPVMKLLRGEHQRVDGRRGISIYGQVRNAKGVPLRFVVVTVPARHHNFAVTAFVAHDSDPTAVLPRVDAIVNGFHVLGRR